MTGAIVFDLDGTLVDSAPDIAAAANRMLAEMGLSALPVPVLTTFIGHGIPNLVLRVIERLGVDPSRHAEMNRRILALYSERPADLTRPYPGVTEALQTLRDDGFRMGVCTNKYRDLSVLILEALDLSRFFDVVIGGDSLPQKKPDPAPLHAAFAGLDGAPVLYVGDSEVDAETATRAGLHFALFTEGYRKAPVTSLCHSVAFGDFHELPELVRKRSTARGDKLAKDPNPRGQARSALVPSRHRNEG